MVKRRKSVRLTQKRQKHHHEKHDIQEEQVEIDTVEQRVSEDYCFFCKDGGHLIECDHKGCLKSYHRGCVGQEEETEEIDAQWFCDWHSCFMCKKTPRYQCYCCPNAVCQSCFKEASFARIRGNKGFCNNCLNLALLAEEGREVDSDGEMVDFKDRDTYEGLFKEYWDIIKEKEGLTLDDLHNADVQIKKGENVKVQSQKPQSDSDESVKEEENRESSSDNHESDHESDDAVHPVHPVQTVHPVQPVHPVTVTKTKTPKKTPKRKVGSSKIEYVGWASKCLIELLEAIGVDTSKKLSQNDVSSLIIKYAQDNKLFHPEKRKMILCDARLCSLLKRKTITIYKVYDGIEAHLLENVEQSDDEGYSSGHEENNDSLPIKKQAWWRNTGSFQNKGSIMEKFQQKEGPLEEPKKVEPIAKVVYSRFVAIVPHNMKMVYLKRSLVESLLEKFETFESKVAGSFVKVKSEPVDPRNPSGLLPVTGIREASGNEDRRVLLQVSTLPNGVSMNMLSNDDLTEEDCKGLCQKIESGLIPKPTVVELEEKAKGLHEDITKHVSKNTEYYCLESAIARELSILKHRIDLANEKGRRAEYPFITQRRDLLQSEEEQFRLLNEPPRVIAEVIEDKPDSEEAGINTDDGNSPSKNPSGKSEDGEIIPAV
ncbi:hypothetical protein KSS87_023119 [Heliosperma pusillum]|nr:hypothetical protein KSS87_023119 [Heliosperma pusillum]